MYTYVYSIHPYMYIYRSLILSLFPAINVGTRQASERPGPHGARCALLGPLAAPRASRRRAVT